MGLWSQIVGGLLVTHVIFASFFWLLGKSWVESKVMAMELTVEVGREAWADRGDRRMPCSTRVGGGGRGGGSAAGSGRQEGAAAAVMLEEEGSAAAAVPRAQANAAPLCARALAAQRQA